MKFGVLVVMTFLVICGFARAQQANDGSVCVAARADDPFWKEPATLANGKINSHGLRLKVDKTPAVAWPDRKSLKIDGMSTSDGHILAVLGADGKPIESVKFKFSEYNSTELCMNYDGYQGIGLQESVEKNTLVQMPLRQLAKSRRLHQLYDRTTPGLGQLVTWRFFANKIRSTNTR